MEQEVIQPPLFNETEMSGLAFKTTELAQYCEKLLREKITSNYGGNVDYKVKITELETKIEMMRQDNERIQKDNKELILYIKDLDQHHSLMLKRISAWNTGLQTKFAKQRQPKKKATETEESNEGKKKPKRSKTKTTDSNKENAVEKQQVDVIV